MTFFQRGMVANVSAAILTAAFSYYPVVAYAKPLQRDVLPVTSLPMVDEAAKDPSFLVFRNRLLEAAKRGDAKFVFGVAAPDVEGFEMSGIKDFKAWWGSRKSEFCELLTKALSNGGRWQSDIYRESNAHGSRHVFHAPSYIAQYPIVYLRGKWVRRYFNVIIVPTSLYDLPGYNSGGTALASLTNEMVELLPDAEPTKSWLKVRTPKGKVGYVVQQDTGSYGDYSVFFEKKNGKWLLVSFNAPTGR